MATFRSPDSKPGQKKRRKKPNVFKILGIWALVVVVGLAAVYFIADRNRNQAAEPELGADDLPEIATPLAGPDPSAAQPNITQRDGVSYVTVDGVEILLVNKAYSVPADFGGEDAEATAAFNRMMADADAEGHYLYLVSGYRSYDTQAAIYQRYVNDYGQEYTDTISARPGHSEHQTGLAFDILDSSYETGLNSSFADTPGAQWLRENAPEYGFILRYDAGYTSYTGYAYEPWHFRYIGDAELARRITDSGLSLEEYIGLGDSAANYADSQ